MSLTCRRTQSHAFTLIELLVVIAIISVLAGILLPVFSRARESGRKVVCASNLRQVGMAIMQYSQDNDERLMLTISNPFDLRSARWSQALDTYVRDSQLFQCPTLPKAQIFGVQQVIRAYTQSYGLNRWLAGSHSAGHDTPTLTGLVADVASAPSNTAGQGGPWYLSPRDPMLCPNRDIGQLNFTLGSLQGGCLRAIITVQQAGRENDAANIHNDGSNYLYIDGHVKWQRYTNRPNSCDDNQRIGGGYTLGCPGNTPGVLNPATNIWG